MNKRWLFWLPLLGIAAWLAFFGDKTPSNLPSMPVANQTQVRQPVIPLTSTNKASTSVAMRVVTPVVILEALIPRTQLIVPDQSKTAQWRNLFASSSWTPPPAPVKAAPPSVPVAPPLPFQYVGKKFEANVWEVYLQRGEQSFLVREGATLEGVYRVDSITPQRLNVTYLPLGQSQSLSIGDSQ